MIRATLLLLLVFAAFGCDGAGDAGAPETATVAAPTTEAATGTTGQTDTAEQGPAGFPTGVFTMKIEESDDPPHASLVGRWTLEFTSSRKWALRGAFESGGKYEVSGNELTLVTDRGCTGGPATFAWAFDEGRLTLKPVREKCSEIRTFHFTVHRWKKTG
jgi:hypothetical protein